MRDVYALQSINFPVQAVAIPNNGSRFLVGLFYYLEQFKIPDSDVDQGIPIITRVRPRLGTVSDVRFVIYRDPIERVLAFYENHISGKVAPPRSQWRKALEAQGAHFPATPSLDQERHNIDIFATYLEQLSHKKKDSEWEKDLSSQYTKILPAIDLGFTPIPYEHAYLDLGTLLSPLSENIIDILPLIRPSLLQNTADVPKLVTPKAREIFKTLYEVDHALKSAYRYRTI